MKPVKLAKKETEKDKPNFRHTTYEWEKPEKLANNIIYAYNLKWNVNRNDDESN